MRCLAFGAFVFDQARGILLRDGRPVPVNHKGIRLLAALLRAPGEVVEKAALIDAAWPETAVEESNLSVQLAALRKLLGPAPDGSDWIATVPRIGYRFAGSISSESAENYFNSALSRPLIVVLPFATLGQESGKDYLAAGITEDIITALTRFRWFRVVLGSSAAGPPQLRVDVAQIGQAAATQYFLCGSVRHSGSRLRISAQLVDAADGTHLWAERYDLAMTDVFAIQDEIAERAVAAIEPELLRSESRLATSRHTGNMKAWDLVRQGVWHFHKLTREDHHAARELFRRACGADADLPESHSWLGRVSAGLIAYGWSKDKAADGREGTNAATRAVALDPRDPYSHYSFAIISCYAGSASTAALAAHRAINLSPCFALGHLVLGMARLFDGNARSAIAAFEHGLTLNPNDPQNVTWYLLLAYAQILAGDPNSGFESAKRALAVRPVFRPTFEALLFCAVARGDLDEARRWYSCMNELEGPESSFTRPLKDNNPDYERYITQLAEEMSP